MNFDSSMNGLHVSVQSGPSLSRRLTLILALFGAIVFATASTACASASADVLYDQTTGTPGGFVPSEAVSTENVSEHGRCDAWWGVQECFAADDFTVPPGPGWYVDAVHVDGSPIAPVASGGVQGTTGGLIWLIFPGGNVPTEREGLSYGAPLSAEGYGSLSNSNDLIWGQGTWGQGTGVALPSGHYWLKVYAPHNNWGWQTQSPQAGSAAVWMDRSGPAGEICGNENFHSLWHPIADCHQPGPDLRFRILGQEMGGNFDKFQLGKSRRMPSGGLEFPHVKLPGRPYLPHPLHAGDKVSYLTVHRVSGKGGVESITTNILWHSAGSYPDSYLTGPLKIKPTPKTKKLLKQGRTLKLRVTVTYTRWPSPYSVPLPPTTQERNIVLKKP